MKMDHGQNWRDAMGPRLRGCGMMLIVAGLLLTFVGCTTGPTETRAERARKKQEQALRDPYGYGGDLDNYDISGGDINHFDRDAFRKDMDDLFNP